MAWSRVPIAWPSARMPASLRGPTRRSFGHFRSGASPDAAAIPSRTPTPAASVNNESTGAWGLGLGACLSADLSAVALAEGEALATAEGLAMNEKYNPAPG